MANMEERLNSTVTMAEEDASLWHKIVHGNEITVVVTDNGIVPSAAKQLKDVHDEVVSGVIDYLNECQNCRDVTLKTKEEITEIKNDTNAIKSETLSIKDETQTIKNEAQAIFNNIATTTNSSVQSVKNEGTTQIGLVQNAVAEQVAEAKSQADRAENATNSKANTDMSNVTASTLFSKMFTKYVSGKSWYRVWPDGWIEQGGEASSGGTVVVTFPKAFKNTNYTAVATTIGTNAQIYAQCITRTSASQMTIYNNGGSSNQAKSWYACGY